MLKLANCMVYMLEGNPVGLQEPLNMFQKTLVPLLCSDRHANKAHILGRLKWERAWKNVGIATPLLSITVDVEQFHLHIFPP